ncbi:hypothetical protein Moror_5147 [Moniliophthora roreri MCA 2997]|uniref:MYND-type domain-containing protein n=1 Tax=Moniliophthora roreri (strain MCA 2997) TaxID=1381753 RepID=V2X661_MONRO|nr:hypothetical protein Moror_5147 [Moniliophthora roreri MCA 2997]
MKPVTLGDEKSDVALAALAILGQAVLSPAKLSESVTLIKTNWDPWIGPWVKFFLNLAEQESFTPPYPLIVDKILYVIPLVVTYPTRCDETRESEIKHLAQIVPYLPPSATKFWLKLLRVMHWSLGHWGRLLTTMLDSGRHKGLLDEAYRRHPDELKEVAKSFIKFINAFNQRIQARQADEKHFHWNSGMLHCILASVVSSATLVRRPIFHAVTKIIGCVVHILLATSNRILGISAALESGMVTSLFKIGRLYPPGSDNVDVNHLWLDCTELLKLVSLYMVYPDLLRRFRKAMDRVVNAGLEELFMDKRGPSGRPGRCVKGGYPNCLAHTKMSKEAAMYCSRHCAERHWKDEAGHRKKCEEWTQARKDGDYYPSDRDSAFLLQLVTEYFSKHGQAIYNELHKFTPPAYLTSPASSTPRSRQEEPFLQRRYCRTQFL